MISRKKERRGQPKKIFLIAGNMNESNKITINLVIKIEIAKKVGVADGID